MMGSVEKPDTLPRVPGMSPKSVRIGAYWLKQHMLGNSKLPAWDHVPVAAPAPGTLCSILTSQPWQGFRHGFEDLAMGDRQKSDPRNHAHPSKMANQRRPLLMNLIGV